MATTNTYSGKFKWENMIKETKIEIATVIRPHQEMSKKTAELILLRQRMLLLQAFVQEQKQSYQTIMGELELLKKVNDKREEKCKRAKSRDFHKKFTHAQSEYYNKQVTLQEEKEELVRQRQKFISHLMKGVFPISLCSNSQEKFHCIGCGSLPNDGNMKHFIKAVKLKKESSHSVAAPTTTCIEESFKNEDEIDSLTDITLSVPAALSLITHCVWIIADVLDQILPHTLILPVSLCEYGRSDRRAQTLVQYLARLDDNITFLAFTQNVSPESLVVGHTLSNLSVLVNHHELGRSGPFTCYPELLHSPVIKKKSYEHDCSTDETEPPLLHTASNTSNSEECSPDLLSPVSYDSDDSSSDIIEGWEEVNDVMIPTVKLYSNRLEYGTSYSEYSQQTVRNESQDQEISSSNSTNYSSGLIDTISSLLGSSWTRK